MPPACAACRRTVEALTATRYFTWEELRCQCGCGHCHIQPDTIQRLDLLRRICAFPLPVTSGYRCRKHPAERRKRRPGAHHRGWAVDIRVRGQRAFSVVAAALATGWRGIGVNQKGSSGRYIHIDCRPLDGPLPAPAIWSY